MNIFLYKYIKTLILPLILIVSIGLKAQTIGSQRSAIRVLGSMVVDTAFRNALYDDTLTAPRIEGNQIYAAGYIWYFDGIKWVLISTSGALQGFQSTLDVNHVTSRNNLITMPDFGIAFLSGDTTGVGAYSSLNIFPDATSNYTQIDPSHSSSFGIEATTASMNSTNSIGGVTFNINGNNDAILPTTTLGNTGIFSVNGPTSDIQYLNVNTPINEIRLISNGDNSYSSQLSGMTLTPTQSDMLWGSGSGDQVNIIAGNTNGFGVEARIETTNTMRVLGTQNNTRMVLDDVGRTIKMDRSTVGSTSTSFLFLGLQPNDTATVGAQKYSPGFELDASGWGTTGNRSQNTKWRMDVQPIQGTAPQGKLQYSYSLNNGAFNPIWNITPTTIGNTATLTVNNNITATAAVTGATGIFTELGGGLTVNQTFVPGDKTAKFSDVAPNFVIQTNGTFPTTPALFVIGKGGQQHNNQTVSTTSGSPAVVGSGQGIDFNNYFIVGDQFTINGETKTVLSITDATHMTATTNFTNTNTNVGFTYPTGNIMTVKNYGGVGIGVTQPAGWLNIQGGTQYFPPIVCNAGTDPTTGVDGALNWTGTDWHTWSGTTLYTLNKSLTGSATLDFPSTGSSAVADLTITVTGAASGDVVSLGVPATSVTTTATYTAWVSATNTVTVRFSPKATEDPASGTFKVRIIK